MTNSPYVIKQQSQLAQQRQHCQSLLQQLAAQGGLASARPATLRTLAEAFAAIAECKQRLRALGVSVADLPEDGVPEIDPSGIARPGPATLQICSGGEQRIFHIPAAGTSAAERPGRLAPELRQGLLTLLAEQYQRRRAGALARQVRLRMGSEAGSGPDPSWWQVRLLGPEGTPAARLDTPPLELFDRLQGQLLVLGPDGAGKTTLLVELALALTARAQADPAARIPLLADLTTWRPGQSLRDWLAGDLVNLLGLSQRLAARLAGADDLLLLLDGLDELSEARRAPALLAIDAYLDERHPAPPLVLAGRRREVAPDGGTLPIAHAVELGPPEPAVVERTLTQAGVALLSGPGAGAPPDTPLTLSLLLAQPDQRALVLQAPAETRGAALWAAYLRGALQRQPPPRPREALRALRALARLLQRQGRSSFVLDDLQPALLHAPWQRGLCVGLIGLAAGLVAMLCFVLTGLLSMGTRGLFFFLVSGLVSGLFAGGFAALLSSIGRINRRDLYRWSARQSWARMVRRWWVFWPVPLGLGLVYARLYWPMLGLRAGFTYLSIMLLMACVAWGLQVRDLPQRLTPGGQIRELLRDGAAAMLVLGLLGVLIGWSIGDLLDMQRPSPYPSPVFWSVPMLTMGLIGGFWLGLGTVLQHYALRLVLALAGLLPLRAPAVLDELAQSGLLDQDGAAYRFPHALMRDAVAALRDEELDL